MSYYNEQPQGYGYGQGPPQSYEGRPQVPPPWSAEWDGRENRWMFLNRETGERTHQHPHPQYGRDEGGYEDRSYSQGYGSQQQGGYYEQPPPKKDHHTRNEVLGVLGGLAGGAFLAHEGEKESALSFMPSYNL
jgi:hypothetical protein